MKQKVLDIINDIRVAKGMPALTKIEETDNLREVLNFTSFDLAELTVKLEDVFDVDVFEDGLVSTIGEIYAKLSK